ncbi:hypothetical protein CW751_03350 [Brumimicrobium salinarum]|uniref:Uncharacterized protein n=1 Tax=Brumimicrobium salinarum TaxID=2058658 RepID=A0A2I0R4Q5_9FLAO|nr:hypothetical protein [Brumimicrobium salinarum]PKR81574.1 hypothetical protein CW751_03350 [Brumimicrobium salinarum]
MKGVAHFYKLNYDFSPEFAEAHHDGNESENNRFYDWQDELELTNTIKSIEVVEDSVYNLQGEKDGFPFNYEIPNMTCFQFIGEDDSITTMACSQSIVNRFEISEEDELTLSVYLEEKEPLTNPLPGIYIDIQDFPKSLVD